MKRWLIVGLVAVLVVIFFLTVKSQRSEDIPNKDLVSLGSEDPSSLKENGGYKVVLANQIPGAAREFSFSFSIFENWQAEAVGETLIVYDPASEAEDNLEKSKVFVKFFRANDFQKPEVFNILSRKEQEINGRPAVSYIISKKEGTAELSGEPSWRNSPHRSADIRLRPENPSLFFVFAKSPDLSEAEFQRFLKSVQFN